MNGTAQSLPELALDPGIQISKLRLLTAHTFFLPHSDSFPIKVWEIAHKHNQRVLQIVNAHHDWLPSHLVEELTLSLLKWWKQRSSIRPTWTDPGPALRDANHLSKSCHVLAIQAETSIWCILIHDGYLNMFRIFPDFSHFIECPSRRVT